MKTLPKLTSDAGVGRFAGLLLNSAVQTHIYHLQTKSYAAHKALESYYEEIPGLTDGIVEMWQGAYGQIVKGYIPFSPIEDGSPILYLTNILGQVTGMRYSVFKKEDTQIQNEIDSIVNLINSTIYKLTFLS